MLNLPDDLDAYDEIYLGYPNYWGTMPMAVYTFLENYDLSGKTIHPFCTHEGSGLSRTEGTFRRPRRVRSSPPASPSTAAAWTARKTRSPGGSKKTAASERRRIMGSIPLSNGVQMPQLG